MSKKIQAVSSSINAVAYLAILFAMPIALWVTVGWPLPTFVPDPQVMGETLSGNRPLPDAFVLKALAVGLWLIWIQLVYVSIVEMISLLQGKLASHTHTLPGLQRMTGRAIATIAFLATSLFARPVGATPLPLVETQVTQIDVASETTRSTDAETTPEESKSAAEKRSRYNVEPGDSWWSIAEQQLGSGHRWQYLREANIGQMMSDGSQISHQTDILFPGWLLVVPEAETAETVTVQPGDSLWSIAQAELSTDADVSQIQAAVETIAQHNDIANPDVVHPGTMIDLTESSEKLAEAAIESDPLDELADKQTVTIELEETATEEILLDNPPEPSQQYATSISTSSQLESSAVASSSQLVTPMHETSDVPHSKSEPTSVETTTPTVDAAAFFVGLGIGGSILAAKVLMRLRARKQYQLAHRQPGAMPKEFDGPLAVVERALYERAEEAELFWIGKALRSLAARPVWDGEKIPQPILAQIDATQIEVVFESADAVGAPIPWISTNEGASWRLPRQVDHEDIPSSEALSPTPTFITAGKNVMINLESLGILNVVGSDEQRQGFIRSLVHEIAFSDSAGFVDIFTTAEIAGAGTHALVRVSSVEEILEETVTWLESVDSRFTTGEISNAYAYRLHNSEDPIAPVLIILDQEDVKKSITLLRLAATRNKPVCVIVLSDTAVTGLSEFVLQFTSNDKATFDPFAIEIEPQVVSADAARRLGDIAKESKQHHDQSPIELALETVPVVASLVEAKIYEETDAETNVFVEDDDSQTIDMRITGPITQISLVETEQTTEIEAIADDFPVEPGELRINVLGHVHAAGIDVELTRQQLSLLTFLACKESATRDTIVDAIWDGQVISKSRFPNLLAETRSKIGRKYLPEATNGLYRLAHSTTDLQLFKKGLADATTSSEPLREITRSLTLINGAPLTVSNSRFWSWVEHSHFAAGVTSLLADAAASAAESYSKAGDHRKAQWACEQGLLASPLDEHLIIKLTKTYVALGKPTLARRLVESWEAQVSSLNCGEPSDTPRKHLAG